jgi:hypothetical protein
MGKVLKLSDETYQRLVDLAQQQQRTPEEMIRAFLLKHENEQYRQANQQMLTQGILTALPTDRSLSEDEFEPESIPGKPLSEMIIEERR